MENYSRAKTIDTYFELIDSKEMEFSKLRKSLESENIDKDELNIVVNQIDKQLIRAAQKRATHENGKNLFYGGLILTGAGVILTLGTYTGIIDFGNYYLVAYGPICGGLITAMTGKSKMNKI